jgi:phage gpG-like protein
MPVVTLTVREKIGPKGSLEAWGEALENPREAVERIGELLEQNLEERFATQTDPWGMPWAPPSPVTVALRGGRVDSGLESKRFARIDDNGKRAVVGIASPAARRRQFGAPNNKMFGRYGAPVPPRPALPMRRRRVELPPDLHAEVMRTVGEYLRRIAKNAKRV